ncbi:uncharacterized protein KRP23_14829 [Phytophthora ramorum]|uniref:uncharacterized protein n=1 Tax=Phytophthora ramorum TaxID=164328 RepID=UPI00309F2E4B|nr:hypothetical protein KRP23_14829 [Phytophthora ramorum]
MAHLDSIKREFELLWDEGRIWVLLICNLVSTSLQLAVDAYLSLGVGGKTRECDSSSSMTTAGCSSSHCVW